jgi:hypothetical protein
MHALIAFFTLLFSMSHSTSIRPSLSPQPNPGTISESAPSRADVAHYQEASVYAGSGCITCQKTSLTYSVR